MKKIMYASMAIITLSIVLFLTNINAPANEMTDADKAYEIMTIADEENRELTAKEITQVEKAAKTLIAYDDKMSEDEKNVHRAISAMYMNLGVDTKFDTAKELYESYTK